MKSFTATGEVESTTFRKPDLEALENLLAETTEDGLRISSINLYFDEGIVQVNTFAELVDEEYSVFEKNPRRISIVAHGRKDGEIWKSVYIDMWKQSSEFRVHGTDQKWVFGVKEQLQRYFKNKKSRDYFVYAQVAILIFCTSLVIPGMNAFRDNRNSRSLDLIMIWLIGLCLSIYLSWWHIYKQPSKILLKENVTKRVDYHLVVAIIGVVLTAIGILVAFLLA